MAMEEPSNLNDPRWQAVQRVAASATFARARRLRDLLVFLGRAAVDGSADLLDEHKIATVFGRPDAADPNASSLVRAHLRLLREKLPRYYADEGAGDELVVELPAGTFVPVFRERPPAAIPPRWRSWLPAARAAAVLLVALLCVGLTFENRHLRRRLAASELPPAVEGLWRQMFDNGLPTNVLLADANVTLIQDLLGFQIPVADYDRARLGTMIEERVDTSEKRVLAQRMWFQRHVPIADVTVTRQVLRLHAAHALPMNVLLARDATPATFERSNAILSGPRRANPWVELYEPRLSFPSHFDEATKISSFENRNPGPGEPSRYSVVYGVHGFCRVAYLPGTDGAGNVLLLTGTDMTSTEVCGEFVGSERWVSELRRRLGSSPSQPLPHFEVILGATLVTSSAAAPEWITYRVTPS
jgi:hypothetical protein